MNDNSIMSTKDYKIFKTKKGNRSVSSSFVGILTRSIQEKDLLSVNPIIVNKDLEVIDGQHRLEAARRLKIPIYYAIFNPAGLEEIQLLNRNTRRWTYLDFMRSYIQLGNKEYIFFKDFLETYHYPFSVNLVLLCNPAGLTKSSQYNVWFSKGTFAASDKERSIEVAKRIEEVLDHCKPGVRRSVRFFDAILPLYISDPQILYTIVEKTTNPKDFIYRSDTKMEYLTQIEQIINKGNYGKPKRVF